MQWRYYLNSIHRKIIVQPRIFRRLVLYVRQILPSGCGSRRNRYNRPSTTYGLAFICPWRSLNAKALKCLLVNLSLNPKKDWAARLYHPMEVFHR